MKISQSKLISIARKINLKISFKEKKISFEVVKFHYFSEIYRGAIRKNYHPDDKMKCPVHFCHGQESVPAALYQLLTKNYHLFSHHRF